jgi:hypothetical protein
MTYNYICRLCGRAKPLEGLDTIPIVGQRKQERIVEMVMTLAKHLDKHHKTELAKIGMVSQEVFGIAIFSQYEVQDPDILKAMDAGRVRIRMAHTRYIPTNETIVKQVESLGLSSGVDVSRVIALMVQMRDALLEINACAVPSPQPQPPAPIAA